jgi:hypothetical protein
VADRVIRLSRRLSPKLGRPFRDRFEIANSRKGKTLRRSLDDLNA